MNTRERSLAIVVLGILITYGIVQFIQSYILEPLVVGTEVNINPLFTIVGLIAGEFVWGIPGMILAETSLSFLGLGLRPPVVSWGVLLQEAQNERDEIMYNCVNSKASGLAGLLGIAEAAQIVGVERGPLPNSLWNTALPSGVDHAGSPSAVGPATSLRAAKRTSCANASCAGRNRRASIQR